MHRSIDRRGFTLALLGSGAALPAFGQTQTTAPASDFNVRRFGASGDGVRLDTAEIQKAIDACAQAGGGVVVFPRGVYRSGTIEMRSGVTLHLDESSTLVGSTDLKDYPPRIPALRSYTDVYTEKSLIYGENVERIGIEGRGTIDGKGAAFKGAYKLRPYLMRLVQCREITVRDVVIRDSPMWVQHYLACEDVFITGIKVHSRVNRNNDGIDIDSCRRVRIIGCDIWSGDDAIVLKGTTGQTLSDVVIADCVLSTNCNALKFGTETNGGFENVAISNCVVYDTRLAGLALEIVDGATMDGVVISNITMRGVQYPIFVRLGDRGRPPQATDPRIPVGALRNVVIQGVFASGGSKIGSAISGLPGHRIENLTLRDITLSYRGGGTKADAAREIEELAEHYPEGSMFGVLPAYGLYCRHIAGLQLENVRCVAEGPEERPALVCSDVERLSVNGLSASPATEPLVRLADVRNAVIRLNQPAAGSGRVLEVQGSRTSDILLPELETAGTAVSVAPEVPARAVSYVSMAAGAKPR